MYVVFIYSIYSITNTYLVHNIHYTMPYLGSYDCIEVTKLDFAIRKNFLMW